MFLPASLADEDEKDDFATIARLKGVNVTKPGTTSGELCRLSHHPIHLRARWRQASLELA
jgi:hypothetical protein